MRIAALPLAVVATLLAAGLAGAEGPGDATLRLSNLLQRDGQCFVLGWKPAPLDATGKPVKATVSHPQLQGVPSGYVSRLETIPWYAEVFRKYPELTRRQRQLDEKSPQMPPNAATPLYQMFDYWLGGSNPYYDICEIGADGRATKSRLQIVGLRPHRNPPRGIYEPSYRQPRADLVKPLLFHVNGAYYSIFGDCQVAGHVFVDGFPDYLAALRYAGNPIYAVSEELPPALQSCGVDNAGMIWLADVEGHIAFFDTKDRAFVQKCAAIEGSQRILIPRDNPSQSVFARDGEKGRFKESHLEPSGNTSVPGAAQELPAETMAVLYSDVERVVFLTADKAVTRSRKAEDAEDKERSASLSLGKNDVVWEALYLAATNQVCLLVGPMPTPLEDVHELGKLDEVTKSWAHMRSLTVQMPPPRR